MDYMTLNAVKSEIRMALISQKANACPMAARVAWYGQHFLLFLPLFSACLSAPHPLLCAGTPRARSTRATARAA